MGIIIDLLATLLLVLYGLLGQNVVLAIIAFTIIVRMSLLPLTLRQQRSMKKMQDLSPKLKQLQNKYKDDRERLVQEQMALYKEHGVSPFAGCLPLIIQLPIIFGLWQAIVATLASNPMQLLGLEDRILIGGLDHLVPLKNTFLWLNLALPDPYFILPILVVTTTYLQQKLIMPPPKVDTTPRKPGAQPDPAEQAERMTRQMTTFMPLMFGFFALSYSSGLSIYFITANIFGIIQAAMMGKANFGRLFGRETPPVQEVPAIVAETKAPPAPKAISSNGNEKQAQDEAETVDGDYDSVEEAVVAEALHKSGRQLRPGLTETRLKNIPAAAQTENKARSSRPAGNKSQSRSKNKSRPKR